MAAVLSSRVARPLVGQAGRTLHNELHHRLGGHRTDLDVWSQEGTDDARAAIAAWNKHLDDLWSLAAPPPWRGPGT
ncbi:hypothetical protein [Streptomyces sp. AK04-3B]|uniref:hypothetical protein n=1 Tax=Streptomyces sp. AK04-3B TaxID=3028650 RepID=UPI0029AE2D9E|nr:hypothetical protein [Streptomyces sp. AK04-3B]MDX3799671.1 hypothetical protein [Streptomyces sp. AK04-3B]